MPAVRHVTLTGTLVRASDEPATGWVIVGVYRTTLAPGADEVLVAQGTPIQLVAGHFETPVPVSTDPNLAAETLVVVELLLDDTRPHQLAFRVTTAGDTLDLADVVPMLIGEEDTGVPSVPWSLVGRPNGIAPLDGAGKVPAIHLPAGGGGAETLVFTQAAPAAVWGPIAHGFGFKPAAVSVFSADFGTHFNEFVVQHLDDDTLRIAMETPTAGVALIR